jgi:hypothetical protein
MELLLVDVLQALVVHIGRTLKEIQATGFVVHQEA